MDAMIITCPGCLYQAGESAFDRSQCDECFCPKCECQFTLEDEDFEEDDDAPREGE